MGIKKQQLVILDFSSGEGIRADKLNYNFKALHEWIKRERLRTAGWGLVEGFKMSANLKDFSITVGDGVMINQEGEEINVDGKTFYPGPPIYVKTEETIYVPKSGKLKLSHCPYSSTKYGLISYDSKKDSTAPDETDLKIIDQWGYRVPILQVKENEILVSAEDFFGQQVKVTYNIAEDRVDTILLKSNGDYIYEKSIISSNPSHVDLADYKNTFTIAVVYWHIGNKVSVEFFLDHRSYRKVYVDEKNRLYLNGKLYRDAPVIYFVPPEEPEVTDIWYDSDENVLKIWREKDGVIGWYPINDHSSMPAKETKLWTPKNMPADKQTFLFDEQDTRLNFVPKTNALTILVDNILLMEDQYEEVVKKVDVDYVSSGRGFKLIEPLDHDAFVQVIVTHRVRSSPKNESFQLTGVFVTEGIENFTSTNTKQVFTTSAKYVVLEDQLEVFVNGVRLDANEIKHYYNGAVATENDRGKMTDKFKIMRPLTDGQKITYKISHFVWSYEQLDRLFKETRDNAESSLRRCDELEKSLTLLSTNWASQYSALTNGLSFLKNQMENSGSGFFSKKEKIELKYLDTDVKSRLFKSKIDSIIPATKTIEIKNVNVSTDYVQVYYVTKDKTQLLIPDDIDYSKIQQGTSMKISLKSNLIKSGANVYVTGFRVGG